MENVNSQQKLCLIIFVFDRATNAIGCMGLWDLELIYAMRDRSTWKVSMQFNWPTIGLNAIEILHPAEWRDKHWKIGVGNLEVWFFAIWDCWTDAGKNNYKACKVIILEHINSVGIYLAIIVFQCIFKKTFQHITWFWIAITYRCLNARLLRRWSLCSLAIKPSLYHEYLLISYSFFAMNISALLIFPAGMLYINLMSNVVCFECDFE